MAYLTNYSNINVSVTVNSANIVRSIDANVVGNVDAANLITKAGGQAIFLSKSSVNANRQITMGVTDYLQTNWTMRMPTVTGNAGDVLVSDGMGNITWSGSYSNIPGTSSSAIFNFAFTGNSANANAPNSTIATFTFTDGGGGSGNVWSTQQPGIITFPGSQYYSDTVSVGNGLFFTVIGACASPFGSPAATNIAAITDVVGYTSTNVTLPFSSSWKAAATDGTGNVIAVVGGGTNNGGLFKSNVAARSTDGGATFANSGPLGNTSYSLAGVAYGNGVFVTVAAANSTFGNPIGYAAFSNNGGGTWTPANTHPATGAYVDVAYGNSTFVAITGNPFGSYYNTTNISYSTDNGNNWATATNPTGANSITLTGVAYGNGLFLAVGAADRNFTGTKDYWTSPNGAVWTQRQLPNVLSYGTVAVAYGSAGWVVAGGGNTGYISTTGTDGWTQVTLPTNSPSGDFSGRYCASYGNGYYAFTTYNNTTGILDVWQAPTGGGGGGPATLTGFGTISAGFPDLGFTGSFYQAATYGANTFVVGGCGIFGGAIMTSQDGQTWTQSSSLSKYWSGFAYGNGVFIGVAGAGLSYSKGSGPSGYYSNIWYSNNGTTWTDANSTNTGTSTGWSSVAYGNSTFVALGSDPYGYSSTVSYAAVSTNNGASWTVHNITEPSAKKHEYYGLAYGAGKWVSVDYNTANTQYSSDNGSTWTSGTSPIVGSTVSYGNGIFLIFPGPDSAQSTYATSTDGVTWTSRTFPSPYNTNYSTCAGTFTGGFFILSLFGASNAPVYLYSNDGMSWTSTPRNLSGSIYSIVASDTVVVGTKGTGDIDYSAITHGGGGSPYTPNITNAWTSSALNSAQNLPSSTFNSIAYVDTLHGAVAVGNGTAAYSIGGNIETSGWSNVSNTANTANSNWTSIVFDNRGDYAIAVANTGTPRAAVIYTDSSSFSQSDISNTLTWQSITYTSNAFVAIASNANTANAAYSINAGNSWLYAATPPANLNWTSVTYGNGALVAVANGSNIVTRSLDGGNNWSNSSANLPNSSTWSSVAYGNNMFVAVANNNIAYSTNKGNTWTGANVPANAANVQFTSVTYSNYTGMFIAVGANSNVAIITGDGQNWGVQTMGQTANYKQIIPSPGGTLNGNQFYAISNSTANVVTAKFVPTVYTINLPPDINPAYPSQTIAFFTDPYGNSNNQAQKLAALMTSVRPTYNATVGNANVIINTNYSGGNSYNITVTQFGPTPTGNLIELSSTGNRLQDIITFTDPITGNTILQYTANYDSARSDIVNMLTYQLNTDNTAPNLGNYNIYTSCSANAVTVMTMESIPRGLIPTANLPTCTIRPGSGSTLAVARPIISNGSD